MRNLIFIILFALLIPNFGGVAVEDVWGTGDKPVHKFPAHSPEWTDFNESDPGEAGNHANPNSVVRLR